MDKLKLKTRQIPTLEGLEALPVGVTVIDSVGDVFRKFTKSRNGDRWLDIGSELDALSSDITLPAMSLAVVK